jgi:hypothetical protein
MHRDKYYDSVKIYLRILTDPPDVRPAEYKKVLLGMLPVCVCVCMCALLVADFVRYSRAHVVNQCPVNMKILIQKQDRPQSTKYLFFNSANQFNWDTWQCSWLRHYATSPKVADSVPDEFIGFFNLPNSSSRTMALGSTQSLTEMSTRNLSGG